MKFLFNGFFHQYSLAAVPFIEISSPKRLQTMTSTAPPYLNTGKSILASRRAAPTCSSSRFASVNLLSASGEVLKNSEYLVLPHDGHIAAFN